MNKFVSDELFNRELDSLPSLKKEFADRFSNHGGLTDIKTYDYFKGMTSFAKFYNQLQMFCVQQSALHKNRGINHTFYCDFIDSPQNNAFCTTINNVSYICLYTGVWVKLNFLFSILDFGINNITNEKIDEKIFHYYHKLALYILEINDIEQLRDLKNIYFKNNFSSFSCNATLCCIEFILNHEFYHINLGHTQFLNTFKNGYKLFEVQENTKYNTELFIPSLDFHTMELEADLYTGLKFGKDIEEKRMTFGNLTIDIDAYVLLLSFSLTVLFSIFDIYGSKINKYNYMKHPHPEFRYMMFQFALQKRNPKLKEGSLNSWWLQGRELALDYLSLFQIFTPNEEFHLKLKENNLDKYMEMYQNNSFLLFEKLKHLRFEGI